MKILFILLLLTTNAYAGSSVTRNWAMPTPPTVTDNQLYNFLYFIYSHNNQVPITTVDPDGSLIAPAGKTVLYNNVGTWSLCFQTTQPTGTVWKCANLT